MGTDSCHLWVWKELLGGGRHVCGDCAGPCLLEMPEFSAAPSFLCLGWESAGRGSCGGLRPFWPAWAPASRSFHQDHLWGGEQVGSLLCTSLPWWSSSQEGDLPRVSLEPHLSCSAVGLELPKGGPSSLCGLLAPQKWGLLQPWERASWFSPPHTHCSLLQESPAQRILHPPTLKRNPWRCGCPWCPRGLGWRRGS